MSNLFAVLAEEDEEQQADDDRGDTAPSRRGRRRRRCRAPSVRATPRARSPSDNEGEDDDTAGEDVKEPGAPSKSAANGAGNGWLGTVAANAVAAGAGAGAGDGAGAGAGDVAGSGSGVGSGLTMGAWMTGGNSWKDESEGSESIAAAIHEEKRKEVIATMGKNQDGSGVVVAAADLHTAGADAGSWASTASKGARKAAKKAENAKRSAQMNKIAPKCFFVCGQSAEPKSDRPDSGFWPYCTKCYSEKTGPPCSTAGCDQLCRLQNRDPGNFHSLCDDCRATAKS